MTNKRSKSELEYAAPGAAVEIGVARRDITPPVGIYARCWGAARHDAAEGVHRPLTATTIVMRHDGKASPLVLIAIDSFIWQHRESEWRVRKALLDAFQLDPARLMIASSHTHSAPPLCIDNVDKPGGDLIEPYVLKLRDALLEAAQEALDKAKPATLTWATGRCDLARNRDLPDPEQPRCVCGFNPASPADDTVLVGRATDTNGQPLATLVNYACHATTLAWDNHLISPDYVGAMREIVEQHTGDTPCLFLQGASGELAPRDQYTGDAAVADRNGRWLGFAVLSALESMLPPRTTMRYKGTVESGAALGAWEHQADQPSTALAAHKIDVALPLKALPSESEIRQQLGRCSNRAITERLERKLRVLSKVESYPGAARSVWIWRVGDAIFVGQPNEAYSLLQIDLRRRFPEYAVIVMNVVNGDCGYLAPAELHDQDIYQVWQSPFEREALSRLIETCSQQIKRMIGES